MEVLSETRVMPYILSGIECTAVYADSRSAIDPHGTNGGVD
jgi:hypothetical protein